MVQEINLDQNNCEHARLIPKEMSKLTRIQALYLTTFYFGMFILKYPILQFCFINDKFNEFLLFGLKMVEVKTR